MNALILAALAAVPMDARQAVLVGAESPALSSATVYALERSRGSWRTARGPIAAVIGRGGFALPGQKIEGDGKTPSGVYGLSLAFGYAASAATKLPYRQAKEDDLWVDDANAPDYNTWAKKGKTAAASFERMRRDDDMYKWGVVIDYNTAPVVKGKGSAIFLHLWSGAGAATSGCVAMSEGDMLALLAWLDPKKKPVVVLGY